MIPEPYTPPYDALLLYHLDERVAIALRQENAYYHTPQRRMDFIRARCARANYDGGIWDGWDD